MRHGRIGCMTLIAGFLVLAAVGRHIGCRTQGATQAAPIGNKSDGRKAARRALLREPMVLDVLWRDPEIWVTVTGSGDRAVQARRFCRVIREHTSDWSRVVVKNETATVTLAAVECRC